MLCRLLAGIAVLGQAHGDSSVVVPQHGIDILIDMAFIPSAGPPVAVTLGRTTTNSVRMNDSYLPVIPLSIRSYLL